jgi:magnesium transporter
MRAGGWWARSVDDVVHIIQEEAGEDVLALSGAGDGDINEPLQRTIRSRMWWLFINLGTAILASSVVAAFEGTIARLVTLAVIMPIISAWAAMPPRKPWP